MWIPAATDVEAEATPVTLLKRSKAKSMFRVLFMKSTMMAPRRFLDFRALVCGSPGSGGAVMEDIGQELCQPFPPGAFRDGTPVEDGGGAEEGRWTSERPALRSLTLGPSPLRGEGGPAQECFVELGRMLKTGPPSPRSGGGARG